MSLGKRVRFYREHRGWTLEQLAERSGVEVGTISALENRKSTRSNFALALATAFDLSIEKLLDESRNWLAEDTASSAPQRPQVQAPPARYFEWPFPKLAIDDWRLLSSEDQAEVQGFALAILLVRKKRLAA
jgi:transcriptional regulator with XRE-family HTH domain